MMKLRPLETFEVTYNLKRCEGLLVSVFFTLLSVGTPMLVLSKSGVSPLGGTNTRRI